MTTCGNCKHGDFPKRSPQGTVWKHTIGRCAYVGPMTPACNRNGQVFAIMAWTGDRCPAWDVRRMTEAEYLECCRRIGVEP